MPNLSWMNAGPGTVRPSAESRGGHLPLTLSRPGRCATVVAVTGPPESRRLLGDLGFATGGEVSVVSRRGEDVIVAVRGSRIALDRRTARQVLVEPVENPGGPR